jgi:hypothetical protein
VSEWDGDFRTYDQRLYDDVRPRGSYDMPLDAKPKQKIKIDTGEGFLSDMRPVEYLIDAILPTGVAYSITGYPGHGKTTLALQFALSVALGEDFSDRSVSQGGVLFLAGENPDNLKWQYAAALAARGIKASDVPIYFKQGRFGVTESLDDLHEKMSHIPNLKLVIVDSLQSFFEGENDNDNMQMVTMAHSMRSIVDTDTKPALLIIAHPAGKTPSKDNLVPRGGGAFLAEIDGNLTVWSGDGTDQTLHHSQKFRGAGFEPSEWVMDEHKFDHLTDIHDEPIRLRVSRPQLITEVISRDERKEDLLRRFVGDVDLGISLSIREMVGQYSIKKWLAEEVVKRAKDEKLIKRYAKKWVITPGGKEYLDD